MAYGSTDTVKEMKKIENTDSDTEITNIRTMISDLIDFYIDGLEDTIPVTDATKLKALNPITNIISHGEYEIRHGDREKGTSRFNYGWSLFDIFTMKYYGVKARERKSAKLVLSGGQKHDQ